jgi:hypothetical protein
MRFNLGGNFSYLYQPLEMDVFCHHLIARGVYIWEGRTLFLSTAHTDADLDTIRAAVRGAVRDMKAGGFFDGDADPERHTHRHTNRLYTHALPSSVCRHPGK